MARVPAPRTKPAPERLQADLDLVERLLPELAQIGSSSLRRAVAEIWVECWRESRWERLSDAPKSPTEPAELSLVLHTRGVTRQALAAAAVAEDVYGLAYDKDHLLAAALLHDVSKL